MVAGYKVAGYKVAGLQGLQGCRVTGLQGFKAARLQGMVKFKITAGKSLFFDGFGCTSTLIKRTLLFVPSIKP